MPKRRKGAPCGKPPRPRPRASGRGLKSPPDTVQPPLCTAGSPPPWLLPGCGRWPALAGGVLQRSSPASCAEAGPALAGVCPSGSSKPPGMGDATAEGGASLFGSPPGGAPRCGPARGAAGSGPGPGARVRLGRARTVRPGRRASRGVAVRSRVPAMEHPSGPVGLEAAEPRAERRPSGTRRVGGIVKPRLTYSRELEMKTTLQELLIYIIFLTDLCILTFGMVNTDMYYLNKVMSNLFLETSGSETDRSSFKTIGSMVDFWKFAEGPLLDGLYWDTWYNNSTLTSHRNSSHVYYENLLLGVAQIRQLKVRNNTCAIYPYFRTFLKECYHEYRYVAEDKSDFGLKNGSVLVVEFPATGGALPSSQFYSVKLLRYVTYYDYFLASCEVIFCLFIFAFIIQEILKVKKLKTEYFKSAWNWLDMLLVSLSIFAIAFNMYRTVEVSLLMESLLSNAYVYPDFYFLAYWQTRYNNMIAINVFFAWIKIFKYISFNKTMTQLSSTLSRCAKDIIGFAIMFFIIFFAYAQLGYLVFGSQVDEFSTFQNCIFTQFRIVLGDFNFASIEQANRILGPIYFITFVFFVFFVLLNMFLAIINDTYSEVKADFAVIPSKEFEISDLIRQSYNKALVKLRLKKSKMEDLYPAGGSLQSMKTMMDSKGHSASKTDDALKLSRRSSVDEKGYLKSPQLQQWKEKLNQKYRSAENKELAVAPQDQVSPQEFQQLFRYATELEKRLNEVNMKLSRVLKGMPDLKGSPDKKPR
ncbi:polycystin-2-like protein 2 isoform X3 [Lepidochelys kempii]|uniref:polycystin-2-like protein 2 isoform X3 n=1 Tax=Lepidochelys kempii TaxID=8472 RepID=UPI003C6FD6F2